MFKRERSLSLALALVLILGLVFPTMAQAKEEPIHITILGTTDMHGNLYNWSYEDDKELDDRGMTLVHSVVEHYRRENPNTLLIDNGDTIQGTILTDDLYNTKLELENPIIDAMNFMGYDAMTLGNHEFNFGLDLIDKIIEEAEFPILAANVKYREDDSYLAKPYTVVEVAGVKVGIIGTTHPQVPRWDASKVRDLKFGNMAEAVGENIEELREKSDIIIATAHANFDEDHGGDASREIVDEHPEIAALLIGHSHGTVVEDIDGTPVGGARDAGKEVVKFDLYLEKDKDGYKVVDSKVEIIETKDFEPSQDLKEYSVKHHKRTQDFISEVIGRASGDFQPENEIKGIPQAQLQDSALIDLINDIQLKEAKADVSAAALFQDGAKILKGDINYADIFNVYKYPNTIFGVEVSGQELKDYMEWSVRFYNTWKPGDINISFNEDIRGYRYDMFQGVDYKVDISKPEGERIVELKFKGKDVKPTDEFKLAINNFRYDNLIADGIIENEPYFDSDPKALRSYIADHIREEGTIKPKVDNNWEIVGIDLAHPARDYIIGEINAGRMELPKSEDGRSSNIKAINADQLIRGGIIPEDYETSKPEAVLNVKVNGKPMNIPGDFGKVFIEEGRTIVPLRVISENLGHEVKWDAESKTITIDGNIKLTIGEKKVILDGKDIEMDSKAIIVGGRTHVPLRFVSEALGYEVKWDEETKTVDILIEGKEAA